MAFKGKIQIKSGRWSGDCTMQSNLTEAQLNKPIVRDFLEYYDKRMISTMLVSGAVGPYGIGNVDTQIGAVDSSKRIGSNGYQFDVMGRIQIASTINAQVGTTSANGTFQLSMQDNYLVPGMNALFNGAGFQARVMSAPTGSAGNWVYTFQSPDGTAFVMATHVNGQAGTKTCMGGYTSYGEKSLRGHGRSHTPDSFIQHMTTQRKTIGISGDAAAQVLWYDYTGESGSMKGWRFEQERQAKAQFLMEDEIHKWDSMSTMKNDDGSLRTKSRIIDENGEEVVQGDGVIQQLMGGNEAFGSGTNGNPTADDYADMLATIRRKSNMLEGNVIIGITGDDGFRTAQREFPTITGQQNVQLVQIVNQESKPGGASVDVGFKFQRFNVDGDQVVLIKHPAWDDTDRYTEKGSDGKNLKSSQIVFVTAEVNGKKNLEILGHGGNGLNRSMVDYYLNGATGLNLGSAPVTQEDALNYVMLKKDLIVLYNTTVGGIISKSA